ncbi:PTS sugar transporter subunit IIA, partial [Xanthomonas citri pv. citri]|nr:PTS sugar transporter subunit IIA [Xanthomonas citri pv. citri]
SSYRILLHGNHAEVANTLPDVLATVED